MYPYFLLNVLITLLLVGVISCMCLVCVVVSNDKVLCLIDVVFLSFFLSVAPFFCRRRCCGCDRRLDYLLVSDVLLCFASICVRWSYQTLVTIHQICIC